MNRLHREVWLIRHGETEWSAAKRHTGRTDVALTAAGEDQATTLGRYLGGRPFALVLCSPLRRAWDTCRLAGYGGWPNEPTTWSSGTMVSMKAEQQAKFDRSYQLGPSGPVLCRLEKVSKRSAVAPHEFFNWCWIPMGMSSCLPMPICYEFLRRAGSDFRSKQGGYLC